MFWNLYFFEMSEKRGRRCQTGLKVGPFYSWPKNYPIVGGLKIGPLKVKVAFIIMLTIFYIIYDIKY
jgi:hypothetical protein